MRTLQPDHVEAPGAGGGGWTGSAMDSWGGEPSGPHPNPVRPCPSDSAPRPNRCSVCLKDMDWSSDLGLSVPAVALCASLHVAGFSVLIQGQQRPFGFASLAFGVMGIGCSLLVLLQACWYVLQRRAPARARARVKWPEVTPERKIPAAASSVTINDVSVQENIYQCRSVSFMDRRVSFMDTRVEGMLHNALEEAVQEDAADREPAPKSRARPSLWALCVTPAFIVTDFLWAACGLHSLWLLTAVPHVTSRRLLFCVVAPLPSVLCVAMRAFALSLFPRPLSPVEVLVFQGGNVILPILMVLWQARASYPLPGCVMPRSLSIPSSESALELRERPEGGPRALRSLPSSSSSLGMPRNKLYSGALGLAPNISYSRMGIPRKMSCPGLGLGLTRSTSYSTGIAGAYESDSSCSRLSPTSRRKPLRYSVANMIGRGGFAEVYLGMCHNTGELICIKQLAHGYKESDIEAMESEVALLKNLHHPNIVQVWGSGFRRSLVPRQLK